MYYPRERQKTFMKWLSHPAWAGISGVVAILTLLWAIVTFVPQAAPIRAGIAQTFSGKSTPALIPTAPSFAPAETLPENIVLKCNECSDPLIVTITSIQVQPQANRMLWSLTLYNNSQQTTSCDFSTFSFQNTLDGRTFVATGDIVDQNHYGGDFVCNPNSSSSQEGIDAGATDQTSVTFSFVPYTKTPYTLTVHVSNNGGLSSPDIAFLPIQITF
jgi:hypothetical protein